MPQVVDSSNLVQLATTGKVPEFKAPEAAKPEPKPDAPTDVKPTDAPGGDAKPADGAAKTEPAKSDQPRDDQGKFAKADDPKVDDDADDADLPERVRRQIGKKHRLQKEAEEFARERDDAAVRAERRAEAAERELERIRSGKSGGPKPGEGEAVDPDEPKQGDFKTVGEYTRALVKYEAEKAGKQSKANAETQRQQEQAATVIGSFVERQGAFRATTPDYDEVVGESELELHNAGMQYLVESDVGPQLAYHLAKHPDEVSRLRKLSPTRLLAELGKLEIKFEKKADAPAPKGDEPKPTPREVSKAPAPIAPLEAKSTPVQKDPSQMSVSELREHRRQEAIAKGKR